MAMKNLKDLTKEEYKTLDRIGMLYVLYPEATGDFAQDVVHDYLSKVNPKFKNGDWVKVVQSGYNASDFNNLINVGGRGVYNSIDYDKTLYRIDGQIKLWEGNGCHSQYCYPLKSGDNYCGYVYEAALSLATPKEIESHLIKEAKRRGYKEGAKVRCLMTKTPLELTSFNYYNSPDSLDSDQLAFNCEENKGEVACIIYKQGQWAEIIKDEPIKIGGYEVKFKKGKVSVGCREVSNDYVRAINLVSEYCMLKSQELQFIANSGELIFFQGVNDNYKIDRNTFAKIIEKLED